MEVRNAMFSPCRRYRYALSICWDAGLSRCMFVMLNPSTADEFVDDPTIRRCKGFARDWGFGGLWVGNLFGFRSTEPSGLLDADDPVGPANDAALRWMALDAGLLVYAWGAWPDAVDRACQIAHLLGFMRARHLGLTASGAPRHPLYLSKGTKPQTFERPAR